MRAASFWAWLAAVLLWTAGDCRALSLRSTRAEAFLGEVRPGSRVSYSRAIGAPLGVENAGSEPATVEVSFSTPDAGSLADGYEAAPSADWARARRTSHALDPGKSASMEITVRVPKDRALQGRQYQLDCALTGRSPAGSVLPLRTRLLLAVGDGDPRKVPPLPREWDFTASPRTIELERAPLGRSGKLRGRGFKGVKLANAGARDARARLSVVREWPDEVDVPRGFAPAPNPRWLSAESVRVPAGAVRTAELELDVPRERRYRGRKWAFLLAVDVEIDGREGRTWLVLTTETEP